MKHPALASRPDRLICALCEVGRLRSSGSDPARCDSCAVLVNGAMLETIRKLTTLPESFGNQACECGHPEMRLLPGGVFHCPACGSEVSPVDALSTPSKPKEHGEAYRAGWMDGRFVKLGSFVDNSNLARWEEPSDRLDYYRGHRDGGAARWASGRPGPDDRGEILGRNGVP